MQKGSMSNGVQRIKTESDHMVQRVIKAKVFFWTNKKLTIKNKIAQHKERICKNKCISKLDGMKKGLEKF